MLQITKRKLGDIALDPEKLDTVDLLLLFWRKHRPLRIP